MNGLDGAERWLALEPWRSESMLRISEGGRDGSLLGEISLRFSEFDTEPSPPATDKVIDAVLCVARAIEIAGIAILADDDAVAFDRVVAALCIDSVSTGS